MKTDKKLIEALKQGSEEAFEELYNEYQHLVYYVIFNILKNKGASEEVMQDTFLKMFQQAHTFDGRYFKAWLLKIAKNLAINRYKKEPQMVDYSDIEQYQPTVGEYKTFEMMRELESILSSSEYEVVILTIVYKMKQKDIAEYLEKPIGTISWLYSEGIKKLRKSYRKGD